VYAVKHDGRHKARCIVDGHLMDVPVYSVYSGIISLCSLHTVVFLAELSDLEIWSTDIGNAYIKAHTVESCYIIISPEFGEFRGHIFVIYKALYGLRLAQEVC